MRLGTSAQWGKGHDAGWKRWYDAAIKAAVKPLKLYPSEPLTIEPAGLLRHTAPAPISAPQPQPPNPANVAPGSQSSSMFNLAIRGW